MKSLTRHIECVFADGEQPLTDEHEEDRAMRIRGIAEGKAQEAAVLARLGSVLAKLVTTYSDVAARDALEALREAFWSTNPAGACLSSSVSGEPK